jgi:hypothetical protein
LGEFDFELRHVLRQRRDLGKDVAWPQAHSQLVRVVENDRVVDRQAER